ncbi:E4 SUMO-protein ligase PIAL2-like isoform X1 [Coffea arabica]|uniref:E4 SUMO-protein ligase PIAL2-like isoform X1 n=1 Tax=Coffea arabica TaxID=13443 RepID=A0ABM4VIN3_COFAR
MTGTALTPAKLAGTGMCTEANNTTDNSVTASQVNDFRISAVLDRLAASMQNQTPKNETAESFNLCLSLARGIDFAIANHEIPSRAPDLPALLKQVCRCNNDALQQAAVMVLMISVKNACQSGWFSDKDSEELSSLANEIASNFCTSMDFNTEPSSSKSIIETIISRFYPRMKMGQILTFLEVKVPGYGAYVKDFAISKLMKHSPEERIRLFVAQTDNVETSSCLVNPQQVNFLLNGKGVERRTNVFMDTGPQLPTIVTHFLKYGSNLLQAVGHFNGNYIVVIALMAEISKGENPTLPDYVQPAAAIIDPDSEVIEGPSRISLNCPISFRHIRTPVKGHTCKHLQCFDFDNYVDINSKRPSWRCPHCNHHCCFTDIRIDQNMVKVLKEVGDNVNDVIISSDGSWKAIVESDDHAEKRQDKFPSAEQEQPTQPDSTSLPNAPPDLLDLTEIDDVMDTVDLSEAEDTKVFLVNSQKDCSVKDMTLRPPTNITNEVPQNSSSQTEDDFWSGVYLSTFGSGTFSLMSDAQSGGVPQSTSSSILPSPLLTDASSPASNVEARASNAFLSNSVPQTEISPTALQLQRFQFGNASISNEYGRSLSIPRQVSRTPVAVQALPAQAPTTDLQRVRNSTSTFMQNGSLAASQTSALPPVGDGFSGNSNNMQRQQQLSRSHPVAHQMPRMVSSQQQISNDPQDRFIYSGRSTGQVSSLQASTRAQGTYLASSGLSGELPHSNQQQQVNLRTPHPIHQSAGRFQHSAQSSGNFFRAQSQQAGSQDHSIQAAHAQLLSAQRAAQAARARAFHTPRAASNSGNATAPVGDQIGAVGSTLQSVPRSDVSVNSPADQDWRPSGRMRGSLSGRAYSEAMNQYIIQPTQQAQAARPPSNVTANPSNASAQLQILMANRAAQQAINYPSPRVTSSSSNLGVSPPKSTGMH